MYRKIVAATLLLMGLHAYPACAHAFLDRAQPAVGATIDTAPAEVRIWFTEKLEPALSSIRVFDDGGKEIDKRDTHAGKDSRSVLEVSLPPLTAGKYKVVWRAISEDTHVTTGNFTFRISR